MTVLVGAVTLKAQEHKKDGTPSGIWKYFNKINPAVMI